MNGLVVAMLVGVLAASVGAETLQYEPAVAQLVGTLQNGRGATPDGQPAIFPAIKTNGPIKVAADPSSATNVTEEQVSNIQLILSRELNDQYKAMHGRKVVATGTLMHAHSGQHLTPVLMVVKQLEPLTAEK
jgi:hypothetical protein